jgi:lysophospholipase L1-like esterase
MKRRLILLATDSLAMPRVKVDYKNTWPYLLQKYFINDDFIDKSKRASTSERLVNEGGGDRGVARGADLLENYNPDLVIIQIGITDCAPRIISKKSFLNKFLKLLPLKFRIKFIKKLKYFIGRSVKRTDVSIHEFEKYFNNYILRAQSSNTKLYIILIARPKRSLVVKNPKIADTISNYNNVLINFSKKYRNVAIIDPTPNSVNCLDDIFIDDFHFNELGNKELFNLIINQIER